MSELLIADGYGGVADTSPNAQANERAYNAMAQAGKVELEDPIEYLQGEMEKANLGAEDLPISKEDHRKVARRLHNATEDYKQALKAADNDPDKVDAAIVLEHAKAEAAHTEWLVYAEKAEEHNTKNAGSRTLRENAKGGDEALLRMVKDSALAKRRHWHAVMTRGEVVEHRPPVPVAADHFDVRPLIGAAGNGRIDGTSTRDGYSETPVVFAPEAFHANIDELIARPAFWAGLDSKATARALQEAGGAYGQLARAVNTGQAGAWIGKIYHGTWYALLGGKTPWFAPAVAEQYTSQYTDKVPIGAVDGAPAGGYIGENAVIQLNDMATEVGELDAFAYAVGTDVPHKYLANSWAMQLGYSNRIVETQTSKAAVDIGLQMTRGVGVANVSHPGIATKLASEGRNKLQGIVKADELKAADIIAATYKLDYEFRRPVGQDRMIIMANGDTMMKLDTESSTSRYINQEGVAQIQNMITFPSTMPFVEEPHINFYLRSYACVENPDMEDLDTAKTTGLWMGSFRRSVIVRRSSLYSAVVPINVMIGGQTKLQERYVHWIYVDIRQVQDNSLRGQAGPVAVVQPNKA